MLFQKRDRLGGVPCLKDLEAFPPQLISHIHADDGFILDYKNKSPRRHWLKTSMSEGAHAGRTPSSNASIVVSIHDRLLFAAGSTSTTCWSPTR